MPKSVPFHVCLILPWRFFRLGWFPDATAQPPHRPLPLRAQAGPGSPECGDMPHAPCCKQYECGGGAPAWAFGSATLVGCRVEAILTDRPSCRNSLILEQGYVIHRTVSLQLMTTPLSPPFPFSSAFVVAGAEVFRRTVRVSSGSAAGECL